jgi:hypothetical protein
MKWLERIIWIVLVAILTMSTVVLWALWQSNEEVWGNEQYLNYMHMLRIQQKLESNELEAAVTSNREWLSMWWGVYLKQQQLNELLISERNFKMLRDEVEASQLGIATPEQK